MTFSPSRSTTSCSGSSGAPLSMKTAVPPGSSASRYAFESHSGMHAPLDQHGETVHRERIAARVASSLMGARAQRAARAGPLPTARAAASEEASQEPAAAERSPQRRPPRRSRPRRTSGTSGSGTGSGRERDRRQRRSSGDCGSSGQRQRAGNETGGSRRQLARAAAAGRRARAAVVPAVGVAAGSRRATADRRQVGGRGSGRDRARRTRPLARSARRRAGAARCASPCEARGFAATRPAAGSPAEPAFGGSDRAGRRPVRRRGTGTATLAPRDGEHGRAERAGGTRRQRSRPRIATKAGEPAGQRRQEDRPRTLRSADRAASRSDRRARKSSICDRRDGRVRRSSAISP